MRSLRTVAVTRYVTPLREGGSVPAIVEADDEGMYVLKFRGAAQGPKALVAELLAGEIGRAADLPVPEIVLIQLDPDLARTEPDPEIQDLIRASGGLNVALDYLPGAVTFDPVIHRPAPALASAVVWFDAFVSNVDRTARNTNMLMWHRQLHLIDQGAALYFHHAWDARYLERSHDPFARISEHVLLPFATALPEAHESMLERLTPQIMHALVALIPDALLPGDSTFATPAEQRSAYQRYLLRRLEPPHEFFTEALRAHAQLV
ncbi:MAG TPA: HipA family kinase [Steroidobacteraceae bacterium]|nr:HipA family kinase [Steroidobacteraceae bacterium]